MPRAARLLLIGLCLAACSASSRAATVDVPAGGDLQSALLRARPGDVVQLQPGAVYVGNFTLPRKDGSDDVITLRTAPAAGQPPAHARISPAQRTALAALRSPNSMPALQTAPGTHHWRVLLVEITGAGDGDLVALGDGSSSQRSLDAVPHDLTIEQAYIHGDATAGRKRCIALNSAATTILDSYVGDCKAEGQDAQAIAGWNGPGPFRIEGNYLEGSAENVLFGGADPAIPDLVPSDIVITRNLIAKPTAWRKEQWQVKNLVELKNARRVTIDHNTIENTWRAAQDGFALLFTVRNQDGGCRWCQVAQVEVTNNVVAHASGGVEILGHDDSAPSLQTQQITIRDNVFTDIDSQAWGGSGYFALLLGAPRDIVIDHNTIIQEHGSGIIEADGPPIVGFTFTNNLARQNDYGIIGTDHAPGNDTISAFFPAAQITANVIADGDAGSYPSGNRYPSTAEFRRQFMSYSRGDYRLVATSPWHRAGTDGRDLGAAASVVPRPLSGS